MNIQDLFFGNSLHMPTNMRLGQSNSVLESWDLRCNHRGGSKASVQDNAVAAGVRKSKKFWGLSHKVILLM